MRKVIVNIFEYLDLGTLETTQDFYIAVGGEWHLHEVPEALPLLLRFHQGAYDVALRISKSESAAHAREITVGPPLGVWIGPADLQYKVGEPTVHVVLDGKAGVEGLTEAIASASKAKGLTSTQCRFCGRKVPLEEHYREFESDCCLSCSQSNLGVLF